MGAAVVALSACSSGTSDDELMMRVWESAQASQQGDRPMDAAGAMSLYAAHRAEFAEVVRLVEDDVLDGSVHDYYGAKLPSDLCHLSATCAVGRIADVDGPEAGAERSGPAVEEPLFLPTWTGVPDDAVGFGYFEGQPASRYDGFGMIIHAACHVGDGWWWMDAGELVAEPAC